MLITGVGSCDVTGRLMANLQSQCNVTFWSRNRLKEVSDYLRVLYKFV